MKTRRAPNKSKIRSTTSTPFPRTTRVGNWFCFSESLDLGDESRDVLLWCAYRLSSASKSDRPQTRKTALDRADRCPASVQATRVCVSALCDLAEHGWLITVDDKDIWVHSPAEADDPLHEKTRVREGHLIERDKQLEEKGTARFLNEMEQMRLTPSGWKSIFNLMRDGRELADRLRRITETTDAAAREAALRQCIDPYVQIVDGDATCEVTGIRLMDVWRYFRHTWTTMYNSIPGRKLLVLIRDRSVPDHPVIGIGALGSAIVQLSARDKWIGWNPETFLVALVENPNKRLSRWLRKSLVELIDDLYIADFLDEGILRKRDMLHPSVDIIRRLRRTATDSRNAHRLYSAVGGHKKIGRQQGDRVWRQQAKTYLFRSKRAATLASLLEAQMRLHNVGFYADSPSKLGDAVKDSGCKSAIRTVLRHVRAKHVGIDMLDITVCGSVAPYNELLGGKLVSLLMASPEIVEAYHYKYRNACSVIASSMAGRAVRRRPRLVLLGTTSLYGVSASQYNRLSIPADLLGSTMPLRYVELGMTAGFGSYHFSRNTLREIAVVAAQAHRGREVNSIFGEGVSPKMRKVRGGLDVVGLPSDALLQHGSPRLVYAIPLAENFRDVLFGLSKRPSYILKPADALSGTKTIVDFWMRRWFFARSSRPEIIERVSGQSLAYPVSHGARVSRDRGRLEADSADQLELRIPAVVRPT